MIYQFSIVQSPSKLLADFFAVFVSTSIWFWILFCVIFFSLRLNPKICRIVFKLSYKVCSFDTKQDVLYKMKPSRTDKLSCVTVLMVKMRSVGLAWVCSAVLVILTSPDMASSLSFSVTRFSLGFTFQGMSSNKVNSFQF